VGVAAAQLAHMLAIGAIGAGLIGFGLSAFAVCWAWINFSWFASAYDTDDWVYRLTTMVQMIGVVVFALGIPDLFHSFDAGGHIDNRVIIACSIVMRVALVLQWLRVARSDPTYRSTALTYAGLIIVAQLGWVVTAALDLPMTPSLVAVVALVAFEMAGPVFVERRRTPTPWHAHHVAER
jgi:low temperature requirement protein LtrA